jgi:hypothetical protein
VCDDRDRRLGARTAGPSGTPGWYVVTNRASSCGAGGPPRVLSSCASRCCPSSSGFPACSESRVRCFACRDPGLHIRAGICRLSHRFAAWVRKRRRAPHARFPNRGSIATTKRRDHALCALLVSGESGTSVAAFQAQQPRSHGRLGVKQARRGRPHYHMPETCVRGWARNCPAKAHALLRAGRRTLPALGPRGAVALLADERTSLSRRRLLSCRPRRAGVSSVRSRRPRSQQIGTRRHARQAPVYVYALEHQLAHG